MSLHLSASSGKTKEIAERVLMPGDPLRAKHFAEKFLTDVVEYSRVRNMLGFTGKYKGVPVSIQGSGMGMPSLSIYATELIVDYHVKKIIRIGTCGALHENIHVRDLVIAQSATTDSNIVRNTFDPGITFAPTADYALLEQLVTKARAAKETFHVGNVLSQDRFYDEEIDMKKLANHGVLAAEMESAALFLIAARHHIQAGAIFTVSNHILTGEETSHADREKTFESMGIVALESIIADA